MSRLGFSDGHDAGPIPPIGVKYWEAAFSVRLGVQLPAELCRPSGGDQRWQVWLTVNGEIFEVIHSFAPYALRLAIELAMLPLRQQDDCGTVSMWLVRLVKPDDD